MKKLSVGLIGFGASARIFHLPLLQAFPDFFEIVAVVERHSNEASGLLPFAKIYRSWESLVGADIPDVVVVCLPNVLHFEVAAAFLRAGSHVVLEKPMSVTFDEADRLCVLASKEKRNLCVFHNRRLDGDYLTVKKLLDSNRLGRLVRAEIRFDRWSNQLRKKAWKESATLGSSLLEDLGSHLLDQGLHLFGAPQEVSCRVGIQRDDASTVDAFRIGLTYPHFWVDLEASMVVRQPPFHWAFHGTSGSFIKSGLDPQEQQLASGLQPFDDAFGADNSSDFGIFIDRNGFSERIPTEVGRYVDFYKDLYATIVGQHPAVFTAEQGREVIRLLEACRASVSAYGRNIQVG